jgi:hypothetical protein
MLLQRTCKGNAKKLCRDTLRKAPKSSCRPFEQCLKGVGNYMGHGQIKVVTRWAHFPLGRGSPANRKKEDLSAYCSPCLHIFQAFPVYFLKVRRFYLTKLRFGDKTKKLKALSGSSPFLLFPTIPLLAKLKLVQQSP